MRALRNLLALTLTLAVATALGGWWAVPLVSAVWTLGAPRRAAVLYAAVAASMAWTALLFWTASGGAAGAIDDVLAQIMHLPVRAPIALTVAYGALLAGSAALVAQAIRPPVHAKHPPEAQRASASRRAT